MKRQLAKILATAQRMDLIEEKLSFISNIVGVPSDKVKPVKGELDEIKKRLEDLESGMNESSCQLLEGFACDSCKTQNMVAIHTRCTSCGKENWVGWWPEK